MNLVSNLLPRAAVVALLVLAGFALAACGSADDHGSNGAATSSDSTAVDPGAFPVTIDNKLGDAVVRSAPERVVALDFGSADIALALGVTPVGMAEVDYAEGKVQPWTRDALRGAEPELFSTVSGYPVEKIAALSPDLILASNAYGAERVHDELAKFAPVVSFREVSGEDTWEENTLRVGAALGRSEQAERLVADVKRQVAAARRANPQFEGKTISFFNLADQIYVIDDPNDFSIKFLRDLGFKLSPSVEALPGQLGRAPVSEENYDKIDADVVMGTSPAPSELERLERSAVFRHVPAIARGAWVPLPISPATSMAFPSPLSIEYGLEEIVPRLARAVRARAGS